jgi:hypothetical protein
MATKSTRTVARGNNMGAVTCRFGYTEFLAIGVLAKREQMSFAELIRFLVDLGLEEFDQR